ncbi:MAG: AMIN domain-containing protein [Candidatus Aminicenantales bacterium]
MKRKAFWLPFNTLSLLVIFAGLGYNSSSVTTIKKISFQPGKLNTRIILETDTALTVARTYYATKAIVLDLDHVNISTDPPVEAADNQLVTGIRVEKTGAEQARLQIQVQEHVPYTVMFSDSQMVIELNRIQRGPGQIPVEPEVQQRLDRSSGSNAFMTKLNVEEKDGQLQFWAKLSGETVSRVFTLEKPLRLVVDVYDAVYEVSVSTLAVDKYGLRKVRVAQFQLNNPRCITRMVFDLNEPKYYDLRSDSHEIAVSFFKEQSPPLTAAGPS